MVIIIVVVVLYKRRNRVIKKKSERERGEGGGIEKGEKQKRAFFSVPFPHDQKKKHELYYYSHFSSDLFS